MHQSKSEIVAGLIGMTAEVMGTKLQASALVMMADDLADYSVADIEIALKRCRRELAKRLTLADIIDRIESADGMPGADEAWALMSRPEDDTVIITEQMAEAMQAARPVLAEGDKVAARMAFKDSYSRIIAEAREKRIKPIWFVSMGRDKMGRVQPIAEAVRTGKLGLGYSLGLLAPEGKAELLSLTGNVNHPYLLEYRQAQLEESKPVRDPAAAKYLEELKSFLNRRVK